MCLWEGFLLVVSHGMHGPSNAPLRNDLEKEVLLLF